MDRFGQICTEILEEIKKNKVNSQHQLNKLKLKVLNKYKAKGFFTNTPKNADIYFMANERDKESLKELLSFKPVRTLSGVSPIALMSEPYPCPHTMKGIGPCTYCPGGPGSVFGDVPQSYTGSEPSTRRSIRNFYDPYLVVFNRLEHYIAMGKIPDKAEIIIQGGTFTFFPRGYQEYFVKYALKAMNDFSKLFFDCDGNFLISEFMEFFELPKKAGDEVMRTARVQDKLLSLKHSGLNKVKSGEGIDALQKSNLNANLLAIENVRNKIRNEDEFDILLKQVQKENETSFIRCVGLTIETKSDFGKFYHGSLMLELGCTRVEIGIQSVYDEVLFATNRGNTAKDNIESIRILKDMGFKINAHYMPGLPLTTKEMDLSGFKQLFGNPDYKPDMLKIYPCMVMKGTKLYEDWACGKFKPLTTQEAAMIIAEAKRHVPKWCRIMRIQRDIPTPITSAGVDKTNLRQYVEKICREKGIRCREIGFNLKNKNFDFTKINFSEIGIDITEYEASLGKEFFIEAQDLHNDILFGFCRLRFPSQFQRPEITKDSALIRELHVFSSAVQIGKQANGGIQHKGIGKRLLKKAEEIAMENGKNKIVIISGIGAREYFRKLGYVPEGVYMVKNIKFSNQNQ